MPSEAHDEFPRDCFHFMFRARNTFVEVFKKLKVASLALPQLTNLMELDLLFPCTINDFRAIMALTPTSLVEKVIIRHGCKLLDFIRVLNNTSVLPRLKYLYFATFLIPRNLEQYAEEVGESLTNCIKYRREDSAHLDLQLKNIVLRNCPPLPSIWLDELEKLGVTKIITETEAKNVISEGSKAHKERRFSDDGNLNIINSD